MLRVWLTTTVVVNDTRSVPPVQDAPRCRRSAAATLTAPMSTTAVSLFWNLGLLGIIICAVAVAALLYPMLRADRAERATPPEDEPDS